ncbi:flippase [Algivirga pacifica]
MDKLRAVLRNQTLMEVVSNINWLMIDRVARIIIGLLINAWVRRYLGPEEIGKWDFALALASIYSIIAALGLDNIIIRDIINHPSRTLTILGTSLRIRLWSGLCLALVSILSMVLFMQHNTEGLLLMAIASSLIVVNATESIVAYNNSQLKSKYTVIAKGIPFFLFAGIKVILILNELPLIAFVLAYVGELIIAGLLLLLIFHRKVDSVFRLKNSNTIGRMMLRHSWPLMVSGLAYMVYMRIDQVMLGNMLTTKEVGVYSTAIKLFEVPMSILTILSSTFFPKLTAFYKKDETLFFDNYKRIVNLMTFLAYGGLLLTFVSSHFIVHSLYGEAYADAAPILIILTTGIIFMFNGGFRGTYLTIRNKQGIILVMAILAASINISLNYFFIRKWGLLGAAIASACTQLIMTQFANLLYSETRTLLKIQLRGLFLLDIIPTIRFFLNQKKG